MPLIKYHCEKDKCRCHFDSEADCINHEKECDKTCDICDEVDSSTEMMAKSDEEGIENKKYCDDCFYNAIDFYREANEGK